MKYKVGDKVRVRRDLIEGGIYDGSKFVLAMSPLLGKIATIGYVFAGVCKYHLSENPTGEYWTDEMLEDVEEEFKLPDNGRWCIKATKENISILGDYWDDGCMARKLYSRKDMFTYWIGRYWCSYNLTSGNLLFSDSPGSNHIIKEKPKGILEITTEQFKKYVLKSESTPVKEEVKVNTLEQSRESLLEEAKRRYPAGTRYYGFNGVVYQIEEKDKLKFFDSGQSIDAVGKAFVYHKSKWAEIVESPKVYEEIRPDLSVKLIPPIQSLLLRDGMYVVGVDPIDFESSKNKGESNSPTNESDFPIISTKRIINFSQLT